MTPSVLPSFPTTCLSERPVCLLVTCQPSRLYITKTSYTHIYTNLSQPSQNNIQTITEQKKEQKCPSPSAPTAARAPLSTTARSQTTPRVKTRQPLCPQQRARHDASSNPEHPRTLRAYICFLFAISIIRYSHGYAILVQSVGVKRKESPDRVRSWTSVLAGFPSGESKLEKYKFGISN